VRRGRAIATGSVIGLGLALAVFALSRPNPDDPRRYTGERGVVLMSAHWCPWCRRLEAELTAGAVPHIVIDVDTAEGGKAWRSLGYQVPITVIGQDVITGYNPSLINARLAEAGLPTLKPAQLAEAGGAHPEPLISAQGVLQ
jgi:glutaredoxin